jgi:hypothetical protein
MIPYGPAIAPTNLNTFGGGSDWRQAAMPVSLACRGKVVVRSVFKVKGGGCSRLTHSFDSYAISPVKNQREGDWITRCELVLPSSGYESENEAATHSIEVKCVECASCTGDSACPLELNKWYSDTVRAELPDTCLNTGKDPYGPWLPAIGIDPNTWVQLEKFEIQSW